MLKRPYLILFLVFYGSAGRAEIGSLSPLMHLLEPGRLESTPLFPSCGEVSYLNDQASSGRCMKDICQTTVINLPVKNKILDLPARDLLGFNSNSEENLAKDPVKKRLNEKIEKYFNLRNSSKIENLSAEELDRAVAFVGENLQNLEQTKGVGGYANSIFIKTLEKVMNSFINERAAFDSESLNITFGQDLFSTLNNSGNGLGRFLTKYQEWLNNEARIGERTFDPVTFIGKAYPNLTFENGVREYFQKAQRLKSELDDFSPFLEVSDFNIDLYLRKLEGGILSSTELKLALNQGLAIENRVIIKSLLDGSHPEFRDSVVNKLSNQVGKLDEQGLALLRSNSLQTIENYNQFIQSESDGQKDEALNRCLSVLDNNRLLLPKASEIERYKSLVAESKSEYIKAIESFRGFSTTSKPILASLLNEVEFSFPYSSDTWVTMVEEAIDQLIQLETRKVENISRVNSIRDFVQGSFFAQNEFELISALTQSVPESGYMEDLFDVKENKIAELCDSLEQKPFADANLTATGMILTSYTSVLMEPEEAKAVLFHEMSHSLEKNLQFGLSAETNERFGDNKMCMESLHEYVGEKNGEMYFSEDFADYMTSKLLPTSSRSGLCEMMYFDVARDSYEQHSFTNSNPLDPHSSLSFRILRHQVDRGETIPQSCEQALADEGIFSIPESCEF